MRKYIYTSMIGVMFMLQGCSDWLNVKPSDRVSEENAFSTISGFKQALNGIYVELNQTDLYGRALTVEFVEILAQRYAINEEATANKLLVEFEYGGSDAKSRASAIWSKAYNLIANTNLLVKNCDVNRAVLSDDYYHIVKGEALALRAMLHFDLFRLFGPVYGVDSTLTSIPYYTDFVLDVNSSLIGSKYIQQVINDLLEAEEYLKDYDPIITYGPKGDRLDNFKSDRNLRLNYYAVQALLARVYLYKGDNLKALEYAKRVIEVQKRWFPWVKPLDILAGSENPDRMFSTEILFALQNLNRSSIFSSLFDASNLKINSLLPMRDDVVGYMFDDEKQDYRYSTWFASGTVDLGGVNYKTFNKYQGKDSLLSQMIPMLRVSEVFLIAAETEESSSDGIVYFNELRNNRGLNNVSSSSLSWRLEEEWRREFIGEGQLFFYYKRNMQTSVMSAYNLYGTTSVVLKNYVMPIPDGELKYN